MKKLLLLLVLISVVGCKTAKQNDITLNFLQKGKARGNLIVTTDAAGEFAIENRFRLGAAGTRIAFDGAIDFNTSGTD